MRPFYASFKSRYTLTAEVKREKKTLAGVICCLRAFKLTHIASNLSVIVATLNCCFSLQINTTTYLNLAGISGLTSLPVIAKGERMKREVKKYE